MSNGRNLNRKKYQYRDGHAFFAMPWVVLDSPAYFELSHPAKSLLWEMGRQYVKDNNGRLLASYRYLRARGWTSADTITRAKKEFIHETVKGHRPNKASWYALTWLALDKLQGYDFGAAQTFVRSAYLKNLDLKPTGGQSQPLIGP